MSSNKTFGLVFTTFFLFIGLWPLWQGQSVRYVVLIASAIVFAITMFAPALLSIPNRIWTLFGSILHKVTNPIILGIMFYAVFTPFGVVMRWFGYDPLRLRQDRNVHSYWVQRNPPGPEPLTMKNQF